MILRLSSLGFKKVGNVSPEETDSRKMRNATQSKGSLYFALSSESRIVMFLLSYHWVFMGGQFLFLLQLRITAVVDPVAPSSGCTSIHTHGI